MSTDQTAFTQDELLASHPCAEPLIAGGVRCHGGFDADGHYISPRTLNTAGRRSVPGRHSTRRSLARICLTCHSMRFLSIIQVCRKLSFCYSKV